MDRKLNRIKTALVDNGKTNKWLAEQLGKDPATVSKCLLDNDLLQSHIIK